VLPLLFKPATTDTSVSKFISKIRKTYIEQTHLEDWELERVKPL
jgi:hypothetical protein